METREITEEETERHLEFFKHIIVEVIDYARKNAIDEGTLIISIAELMIYLFKREKSNEAGSTRDKYTGTDSELDREGL